MNLVPIQITIQAATAADARQLVHDLAGTMSTINPADVPAKTTVSTVEIAPVATYEEPANANVDVEALREAATSTGKNPFVPKEDKPVPTDVELRALAGDKAKSAGREKVKALLEKYGAASVTAVPSESRAAFKVDLEAL